MILTSIPFSVDFGPFLRCKLLMNLTHRRTHHKQLTPGPTSPTAQTLFSEYHKQINYCFHLSHIGFSLPLQENYNSSLKSKLYWAISLASMSRLAIWTVFGRNLFHFPKVWVQKGIMNDSKYREIATNVGIFIVMSQLGRFFCVFETWIYYKQFNIILVH